MPKYKEQDTAFYQGKKAVLYDFSGGAISSDGGLVLLEKVERKQGLISGFASQLPDQRDGRRIRHSYEKQIKQRVFSMAAGYEDCNDADHLADDPVLGLVVRGAPCSQPTLSRMENSMTRQTIFQLCHWWVDRYVAGLDEDRKEVVIDIDSTDDPTHGKQQLSLFHAYTWQFQYDQLFYIDGDTGQVILPVLRPGNSHTARWSVKLLGMIVDKIRARFPQIPIVIRADSGYSSARFYDLVEEKDLLFCVGLAANEVLKGKVADLQAEISEQYVEKNIGHQHITEAFVYQARTWKRAYNTYAKIESTGKGLNTRFFVSNLQERTPREIYFGFYVMRGETCENRIKEIKNMCFSDRLSCHGYLANFFRLFLSCIVYELFGKIRELLAMTHHPKAGRWQVDNMRLFLIKAGVSLISRVRSVRVRFSSAFSQKEVFRELMRLC